MTLRERLSGEKSVLQTGCLLLFCSPGSYLRGLRVFKVVTECEPDGIQRKLERRCKANASGRTMSAIVIIVPCSAAYARYNNLGVGLGIPPGQ